MPKKKDKKLSPWAITVPIALLVLIGVVVLFFKLEGKVPEIRVTDFPSAIGAPRSLSFNVSDPESGIRKIWVGILQNGRESVLLEKEMARKNVFTDGDLKESSIEITLDPKEIGLSDGEAVLRISVRDYAWRDWGHGNVAYMEKTCVVDTKPAQIEVLSNAHNVAQGGVGLIVYRLSEACSQSGVLVGENFFPGASGYFQNPMMVVCFFALRYDQGADTALSLTAVDGAGNESRAGFYHHIQAKKFKNDTINITDGFLNMKLPEFNGAEETGGTLSPIEQFLKINGEMRAENYETIVRITDLSDPVIYWEGRFKQLPNSEPRAGFADMRDYYYEGKKIDHQTHLGLDLASTANSQVPAANNGRIAFAGRIGIYGNTVVIDHGLGLFSLYSHLSSMSVQEGHIVNKGDAIGRTGTTGLAGGDHLHFSILVHNTFVTPIEWLDETWIENNISSKLTQAASMAG